MIITRHEIASYGQGEPKLPSSLVVVELQPNFYFLDRSALKHVYLLMVSELESALYSSKIISYL